VLAARHLDCSSELDPAPLVGALRANKVPIVDEHGDYVARFDSELITFCVGPSLLMRGSNRGRYAGVANSAVPPVGASSEPSEADLIDSCRVSAAVLDHDLGELNNLAAIRARHGVTASELRNRPLAAKVGNRSTEPDVEQNWSHTNPYASSIEIAKQNANDETEYRQQKSYPSGRIKIEGRFAAASERDPGRPHQFALHLGTSLSLLKDGRAHGHGDVRPTASCGPLALNRFLVSPLLVKQVSSMPAVELCAAIESISSRSARWPATPGAHYFCYPND